MAVEHLTGASVGQAPPPCRDCMWWQTRPGRAASDKRRFVDQAEAEFGPWGKLYRDGERVVGAIQYGPATLFPRAAGMPAGPPDRDAVLVTCAYLTQAQTPWVLQSLFLAAIGECEDRGLPALEAFAHRYDANAEFPARFLRHRTIFPSDFLRDFGFAMRRSAGRIELMRLDLRTLERTPERGRLERVRARLAVLHPTPAPAP
jgi:hypothetical protein